MHSDEVPDTCPVRVSQDPHDSLVVEKLSPMLASRPNRLNRTASASISESRIVSATSRLSRRSTARPFIQMIFSILLSVPYFFRVFCKKIREYAKSSRSRKAARQASEKSVGAGQGPIRPGKVAGVAVRIAFEIVLVFRFGLPEWTSRLDLGDDRAGPTL